MTSENRINISSMNWKGPPDQSQKKEQSHGGQAGGEKARWGKEPVAGVAGRDSPLKGFPGGCWLRVRRPTQGTRVPSLLQDDAPCLGATRPVRPNYRACALQPGNCDHWNPSTPEPALQHTESCNQKPRITTPEELCSPPLEEAHA